MNIWKPTQAECNLIKEAAHADSYPRLKLGQVILEPGLRHNVDDNEVRWHMNIARVTKLGFEGDWNDTDLADFTTWEAFRAGVELTDAGEAIVDFYIRCRFDNHPSGDSLFGNMVVYYAGGRIVKLEGVGRSYPVPQ